MRLGVNIDHVATIRNARGGHHPDPVEIARLAERAGADGITAHLREDRRHISDRDILRLSEILSVPLNFEMAPIPEMLAIGLRARPHAACLVPERREERTTEGGLDVAGAPESLKPLVEALSAEKIRVSLFIEPEKRQLDAARELGADCVELHTGRYAEQKGAARDIELARLRGAASYACELGIECHAGHGLTFANTGPVAAIPEIVELNIGHFLISEALFTGIETAIATMRRIILQARLEVREAHS